MYCWKHEKDIKIKEKFKYPPKHTSANFQAELKEKPTNNTTEKKGSNKCKWYVSTS